MLYISGPSHGGPGLVANASLEGTYSEVYPNILAGQIKTALGRADLMVEWLPLKVEEASRCRVGWSTCSAARHQRR